MSHYLDIKTQITDEQCLITALMRIENHNGSPWHRDKIEVHHSATNLYGFRGDRRDQKANVIIRKKDVGIASNDIGFARNSDGTYTAIISKYDKNWYNDTWIQRLTTYYGVEVSKKELTRKGIKYKEAVDDKGRIQLKAQITKGVY